MKITKLKVLLSVFAAGGLALAATVVQAHGPGELKVVLSSNPRFPIVGQPAQLTFTISNNGTLEVGQEPMVMLAEAETGGHTHGPVPAAAGANPPPAGGNQGSMAGMDMAGGQTNNAAPVMLMPVETSPGVYVANTTFTQGGRYVATVSIGDDEADVVVGVRSSPVAWWLVGALAGLCLAMAATVAVIKTVRRTW